MEAVCRLGIDLVRGYLDRGCLSIIGRYETVVDSRPLNTPFVEAIHKGDRHKPTSIVIRLSDTTTAKGAALGLAKAWHRSRSLNKSAHFVVDEEMIYQCVDVKMAAKHSGVYDKGTICVVICGEMSDFDNLSQMPAELADAWANAAKLVGTLCSELRIRRRILTDEQKSEWIKWRSRSRGGIINRIGGDIPSGFMTYVEHFATVRV
jgi:hypothetical protein